MIRTLAAMAAIVIGLDAKVLAAETPQSPFPILSPMKIDGLDPLSYLQSKNRAAQLVAQSRWQEAEPLLREIAQAYPFDGQTWHDLGTARMHLADPQGAAEAFIKASQYGLAAGADGNAADAARALASAGKVDDALHWLEISLHQLTYREPGDLLAEHVFDKMRAMPGFLALAGQTAIVSKPSRVAKLNADLDYYMKQYALFRFPKLTPAQIARVRQGADDLRTRLPVLSDDQVVMEFERLSAMAPGGHNTLRTLGPGQGLNGATLLSLPVDFYLFPEGLFIIGATDSKYNDLVGSKVLKFGDIPVMEMLRRVAPLIDRDPNADSSLIWHGPEFLTRLPALHDLGATSSATQAQLTVETAAGVKEFMLQGEPSRQPVKLYPSRTTNAPAPLSLAHVDDNYWYTDLEPGTVYVQFNAVIDKPGQSLMEFGVALRKHLAETGAKTVIVDARFNGGGNTFKYLELLKTLVAFDVQPGHRLYYIEGRATFSAAVNFTTDIRRLTNAIFAGEPASAPRAAGDPVFVSLPNTGLHARFSTNTWSLYDPDDNRTWIPPDLPVVLTAKDYFANVDPVMDAIRKDMARAPSAAEAR